MRSPTRLLVAILAALAAQALASAQEWSSFRGPGCQGVGRTALPAELEPAHIAWRVPSGRGHSSPVLWGARLFLTREVPDEPARELVAYDADSGEELWARRQAYEPYARHPLNSSASSTAAADAERVYVAWTDGAERVALAFDHEGALQWRTPIGPYGAQHGGGGSPVLFDCLLLIANEHEAEGCALVALDAESGEPAWELPRTTREQRGSYAPPVVLRREGLPPLALFVSTSHGLTAVDPLAGEVAWELPLGFAQRFVAAPALAGDRLFLCAGSGGAGQEAAIVRLPSAPDEAPRVEHGPRRSLPYVPGAVAVGARFYLVSDGGTASCLDAESGELRWRERLDGTFFSSPISDGAHVRVASREGTLFTLAATDEYALLGRLELGAPVFATPAIANGALYVRTEGELLRIGPVTEPR